jgi:guanylate kinase
MKKPGKLFIVSAPSGAGKTTLVNNLCDHIGVECRLERVITYTTKKPRPGESDGKDYYFLSKDEFERKAQEGFFIEWSTAYGHYYGSPRYILNDFSEGRSHILIIDRQGAKAVYSQIQTAVLIWIYTENIGILSNRLRQRNTENDEDFLKRIALAQKEIEDERINSFYHYHVLNDNVEIAVQKLIAIVLDELKKS